MIGILEEIRKRDQAGRQPTSRPTPPILNSTKRYNIGPCVGTGGFGHVYRATDISTGNSVAIKIPREDKPKDSWTTMEFWALQKIKHNNVVSVYDHGTFDGRPYLVTEFIEGPSLADWLKQRDRENVLPIRAAVSLVAMLASAVECCHANMVVHRDLKPSNVMLQTNPRTGTVIDGLPERLVPRITDFGLSRPIEVDPETNILQRAGTVAYMAPEQAEGRRNQGRAVDIHSLGVILYELLTGSLPFRGESDGEIIQKLLYNEPRSPRLLRSRLPRDLETICLKCLQKDPDKRYHSAADLESDLRAFLDGRPISARPISRLERTVRWAKRKPTEAILAAVAGLSMLALVVGTVAFIVILAKANRELSRAVLVSGVQLADKQEKENKPEKSIQTLLNAQRKMSFNRDPGFSFRRVWHRNDRRLSLIETNENAMTEMILTAGEREHSLVISDYQGRNVAVWDPLTRRQRGRISGVGERIGNYQADPSSFLDYPSRTEIKAQENILQQYDVHTLKASKTFPLPTWFKENTFVEHFHGEFMLIACIATKPCEIRDVNTFELVHSMDIGSVVGTATSPDGKTVALMIDNEPEVGPSIFRLQATRDSFSLTKVAGPFPGFKNRWSFGFSPDSRQIAVATYDESTGGLVQLVDLETHAVRVLARAPGAATPCFSPDGKLLAYGIKNGGIEIRSLADGELRLAQNTEAFFINGLAFSPDGRTLYSISSEDPRIWCWHLDSEGRLEAKEPPPVNLGLSLPAVLRKNFELNCTAFSPNGKTMALGGENGVLWIGNRSSVEEGQLFWFGTSGITAMKYFQNGQRLALGTWDKSGDILIIDPETGRFVYTLSGHTQAIRSLDISSNGIWLASGSRDGTLRLWDLRDPAKPGQIIKQSSKPNGEDVRAVAFSPDSRYLAIGDNGFEQSVYDLKTNQFVYKEKGSQSVQAVAFSPEGDSIAFGDGSGSITLLTWPGKQKQKLTAHDGLAGVLSLAYDPTGQELASGGANGKVVIWDTTSGNEILTENTLTGEVRGAEFAPDGFALATVDANGRLHMLEAPQPKFSSADPKK